MDQFNENSLFSQASSTPSHQSRPHSLSSIVNVDHPQHQKLQSFHFPPSTLVNVRKEMNSVPVTFITSNRSTYSDVMSISNTARVKTQRKAKIASHRVRFPYDTQSAFKAMGAGIDEKHTTMLEKQQTAASRARKNRELHAEHDLFMERLTRERQARTKIEGEKVSEL